MADVRYRRGRYRWQAVLFICRIGKCIACLRLGQQARRVVLAQESGRPLRRHIQGYVAPGDMGIDAVEHIPGSGRPGKGCDRQSAKAHSAGAILTRAWLPRAW